MRRFLTSRLFRAVVCLIVVCCVLVLNSPVRVYAFSGVIGGAIGGAASGMSLGEIGALILAAFGVVFGIAAVADVGSSFEECLDYTVQAEQAKFETNQAMQDEVAQIMEDWIASAKAGYIKLDTGVEWIVDSVKAWAAGFIKGDSYIYSYASCYGTLGVGSTLNHSVAFSDGSLSDWTVSILSCSEPVYSYVYCLGSTHYTRLFSLSPFTFSSSQFMNSAYRYYSSIYDKYFYMTGWSASFGSSWTYSMYCNPGSEYVTSSDVDALCVGLLFDGFPISPVYPELITGGIVDQISQGVTMDVIGLPDISVPGADVLPVNPSESQTEAAAITDYLLAALLAGTITWEQYWQLLGVYSPTLGTSLPTIAIPNVDPALPPDNFELGDNGIGSNPVTSHPALPYALDLKDFFPFCIPFDLYKFFSLLCAEPEAPVFTWVVQDLSGNSYPISVDLSKWDNFAALFRKLQLFVFIIGLAMSSRKFIKW